MVFYECVLQVKHHTSEWAKGGMDGQKIDHFRVLDGFFLTSGLPLSSPIVDDESLSSIQISRH